MGSFGKQTRISLHFLALSFIQSLELHEATVLRLVWMFKLLFLTSPSERANAIYNWGRERGLVPQSMARDWSD